jgi:hypothetical protein
MVIDLPKIHNFVAVIICTLENNKKVESNNKTISTQQGFEAMTICAGVQYGSTQLNALYYGIIDLHYLKQH